MSPIERAQSRNYFEKSTDSSDSSDPVTRLISTAFFTKHWFRMKRAKIRAQEAFQGIKRKRRNATPSPIFPLCFFRFEKTCSLTCARRQSRATDNRGGQSAAYWVPAILFSHWFTRETREKGYGSRLEIRGSARREAEKRKKWGWRHDDPARATDLKSALSGHEWRASLAISSFDRSPGRDHGLTINGLKGGNCALPRLRLIKGAEFCGMYK